jgi:SAM-dependent methyltransferase
MNLSRRARMYSVLGRVNGSSRWRAASLYLGAGLLNVSDFRSPSIARWEAYDNDNAGLEAWEAQVYADVLRPTDRVLLIGCGRGRDLLAMRQGGYQVTGLEQSPALADRARALLSSHRLPTAVVAEPIESYTTHETYDVIVFSPYTYSYLQGRVLRVAVLTRLRERLSPDGRMIISYPVVVQQSCLWIFLARVSSVCSRSDWWPETGDRLYGPSSRPEQLSFEHQFSPDELARECGAADFRIIRDEPISPQFRFAIAVLTKRCL